jgi:hypothetical protein
VEDTQSEDECEAVNINEQLEFIVDVANDDSTNQQSCGSTYSGGGARMFKVEGEIVLVTQAQSYRHRGEWFQDYSAIEFEVIVDILPRCEGADPESVSRGRPKRRGFDLSSNHSNHSLSPHFQGFIRTKFKTAMLGGPPPPSVPKNGKPSSALSRYILCLFYPWSSSEGVLPFQPTPKNLLLVCNEWNSTETSFVNAQRYRIIDNVLQKHYRSSTNERACSEWRSRNADFWSEGASSTSTSSARNADQLAEAEELPSGDAEAAGLMSTEDRDLYALTKAAAAKDQRAIDAIRALRSTFQALIPPTEGTTLGNSRSASTVYRNHLICDFQLSKVAQSVHAMPPPRRQRRTAWKVNQIIVITRPGTALIPSKGTAQMSRGGKSSLRTNRECLTRLLGE